MFRCESVGPVYLGVLLVLVTVPSSEIRTMDQVVPVEI
jgi:hypothetical protein